MLCGWPIRRLRSGCELRAGFSLSPLLRFVRNGSKKRGSLMLVARNPDIAAVNQRHSLGHRKADPGTGCAAGVGGGTIVAVEDAFAVCHGNYRAKTVHGKDDFSLGMLSADSDSRPKNGVLT